MLHSRYQADRTDKVYKVCEMQVDEASEMRRDDTQAQERKEVEWGRRS